MCKILTVYKYHGTAVGVFEPAASKFVDTQNNHFEIATADGENGVISSVIESVRSGFHCAEVQFFPVRAPTGTSTVISWLIFGLNVFSPGLDLVTTATKHKDVF